MYELVQDEEMKVCSDSSSKELTAVFCVHLELKVSLLILVVTSMSLPSCASGICHQMIYVDTVSQHTLKAAVTDHVCLYEFQNSPMSG